MADVVAGFVGDELPLVSLDASTVDMNPSGLSVTDHDRFAAVLLLMLVVDAVGVCCHFDCSNCSRLT